MRRSAGSVKVVGSQSLRAGERLSSESRRERRGLSHESRQHKDYWHAHLQPRTRRMVLTDASRSCHDSSPRPIEASSAVADDGEQRRTSVSGSRWWTLPFTRCVSLPKQDLSLDSFVAPHCAGQVKSVFHPNLYLKTPSTCLIFSPSHTPGLSSRRQGGPRRALISHHDRVGRLQRGESTAEDLERARTESRNGRESTSNASPRSPEWLQLRR